MAKKTRLNDSSYQSHFTRSYPANYRVTDVCARGQTHSRRRQLVINLRQGKVCVDN